MTYLVKTVCVGPWSVRLEPSRGSCRCRGPEAGGEAAGPPGAARAGGVPLFAKAGGVRGRQVAKSCWTL